jgi:acetyl esterase/lipase
MYVPGIDRRKLLVFGLMAPALASCTAVGAFNALVPYDRAGRIAASNIAFGPDPRQSLDIYAPITQVGLRPVVLFIYGGSWNNGSRSEYGFVGHALASQGFVTVIINYRLIPQVRFPAFIQDAALATAWIKSNISAYGGDPKSMFVMGHSAGAYNAAMVSLDLRYVRRAGIAGQPFRGLIGLAGPYDFLPFDVRATREAFGEWPDPRETQPVFVATDNAPPESIGQLLDRSSTFVRHTRRVLKLDAQDDIHGMQDLVVLQVMEQRAGNVVRGAGKEHRRPADVRRRFFPEHGDKIRQYDALPEDLVAEDARASPPS